VIAKGCVQILVSLAVVTLLSGVLYLSYNNALFLVLFLVFFGVTVFSLFFFRDPPRHINGGEGDMVSPADGRVIYCDRGKICIFMGLGDVHVNRAPLAGRVKSIEHRSGNYIPAFKKESEHNEQNHIILETAYGDILITQIAGAFARRIVTYIARDGRVVRGQRIGMIRYGSRVDVTVPPEFEILVSLGDKVRCGETIIARVV
jgi:phosphatidylserine decarboxylase